MDSISKKMPTDKFLNYLKNKKFVGIVENYTHKFTSKSSVCGDKNILYLKINKNNIIYKISYENLGCGVNSVILEIICEYLINKNFDEIKKINIDLISSLIDFPTNKIHCANLVIDIFKNKYII